MASLLEMIANKDQETVEDRSLLDQSFDLDDNQEDEFESDVNERIFGGGKSLEKLIKEGAGPEEEEEEENPEEDPEEEQEEEQEEDPEEEEEEEQPEPYQAPDYAKDIFPDREFANADEFYQANFEKIQGLETDIQERMEAEAKLMEIIEINPEFTDLLRSLGQGDSFRVALIKAGIGPEDFSIESTDEEDAESLIKAKISRENTKKEQKRREAEFVENQKKSEEVIRKFQTKRNITDSVQEKFISEIGDMISSIAEGNITEKQLDNLYKALNYDKAVETATEKGKIAGKNEKVSIERKRKSGDGLPRLSSGGAIAQKSNSGDPVIEGMSRMLDNTPSSLSDMIRMSKR